MALASKLRCSIFRRTHATAYHSLVCDGVDTEIDHALFDAVGLTRELRTSPGCHLKEVAKRAEAQATNRHCPMPIYRRLKMSIQIQTVLLGHPGADELAICLEIHGKAANVTVRSMHKPDYKLLEGFLGTGQEFAVNAFLNSYALEDHTGVFNGPSTFLTVQYDPALVPLMEAVAGEFGGYVRVPSSPEWKQFDGHRSS
jgi:hypothetical protein